jgi:hypothetical protein
MPKYSVDINVASRAARGVGGKVAGAGTRENVRLASQRAQEIRKDMKRKKDPTARSNVELSRSIGKLQKTITSLEKTISRLSTSMARISRRARREARVGTIGAGRGVPARAGIGKGAGVGRMGAALGIIGAPVAALGFAISKITQIGRAHIQRAMEQYSTAGVGGFQRSGKFLKTFTAAEFGAYEKERRMAAGVFETGTEYPSHLEWRTRQVGKGKRKRTERYQVRVYDETLGMMTSSIFGMGAQTAKIAGFAQATGAGKGKGEQFLEKTISRIVGGQRGLTTELPFILNEMASRMENAVTEGVNASTMASDMAHELAITGRQTLTGQARSAARTQRDLVDTQKEVARNQGADIKHWQMRLAARDIIQGKGKRSDEARDYLVKSGIVSTEDLKRGLNPEQMRMAVQFLNQSGSLAVRQRFVERVVPTLAGKGTQTERLARFHKLAQDAGISIDPTQSRDLYMRFQRQNAPERLQQLMNERSTLEQRKKETKAREDSAKNKGFFGQIWEGTTGIFRESSDDINKRIQGITREIEGDPKRGRMFSIRRLAEEETANRRMRFMSDLGGPAAGVTEAFQKQMERAGFGGLRQMKGVEGRKEQLLLGGLGATAATATQDVEIAFINLAGTLTGKKGIPINKTINALSSSVITLSKAAGSALKEIMGVAEEYKVIKEKGITNYIGQRLGENLRDPNKNPFLPRNP